MEISHLRYQKARNRDISAKKWRQEPRKEAFHEKGKRVFWRDAGNGTGIRDDGCWV